MPERWVVDSSPLIALARVGTAGWLAALAEEIVVPADVAAEVAAGPPDEARAIVEVGGLRIVSTPPPPGAVAEWDLGAGETAVLALCLTEPGWTAILDDEAARRCARSLSVPVRGTLAVVILARHRGLTSSAAGVLRAMRANGFRLDDDTIRRALAHTVGETWPPG
jgi:predicted nucleic acid-binding protein